MPSRHVNVNTTEQFPFVLHCAVERIDVARHCFSVSELRRTVSSAVQHRFTPPPALHRLSIILHSIFHRAASVLMAVAVFFARAPFVLSGGLRAIFVAASGSSRCLFSLPFSIPFGLLLIKLTLGINIQLLVNFLIHNLKNKEYQQCQNFKYF